MKKYVWGSVLAVTVAIAGAVTLYSKLGGSEDSKPAEAKIVLPDRGFTPLSTPGASLVWQIPGTEKSIQLEKVSDTKYLVARTGPWVEPLYLLVQPIARPKEAIWVRVKLQDGTPEPPPFVPIPPDKKDKKPVVPDPPPPSPPPPVVTEGPLVLMVEETSTRSRLKPGQVAVLTPGGDWRASLNAIAKVSSNGVTRDWRVVDKDEPSEGPVWAAARKATDGLELPAIVILNGQKWHRGKLPESPAEAIKLLESLR